MPWVAPAIGAVSALGSAALSSGGSASAGLSPFRVNTPNGSAQVTKRGVTSSSGGIGEQYASQYGDIVGMMLGRVPGAPSGQINLDPNALLGAGTDNSIGAPWAARGNALAGNGMDVLSAFQGFNPDQFAAQQFDRLNRLAAPAEDTAARQTANRLFGSGRLGPNDSRSSRTFGELDRSMALARDDRLGRAIDLAGTESDRLLNQGLGLMTGGQNAATTGENLQASGLQRFLAGIQGAQGQGQYNTNYLMSLLSGAASGQQGIQDAFAGRREAISTALTGAGSTTAASLASAKLGGEQGRYLGDLLGTAGGSIADALGGLTYSPTNTGSGGAPSNYWSDQAARWGG